MNNHKVSKSDGISNKIQKYIKIKNKTKLKELTINLWLLNENLKPAVLMDFCQLQVGGYLNLVKSMFGDDGLVMKLDSDYLIVKKSGLLQHLQSVLTNPMVFIDISDSESKIIEVHDPLHQNILSWIKYLIEKLLLQKSYLLEIESEEDWNLCTVFGILLGYPTVYWFPPHQECKSLNNQDIMLISLKYQNTTSHSFSVPYKLFKTHQHVQESLSNWTKTLCDSELKDINEKNFVNENFVINGMQFEFDMKVVNLPFVAL